MRKVGTDDVDLMSLDDERKQSEWWNARRRNGYYIVGEKKRPELNGGKGLPHRAAEETQRERATGGDDEFQLVVVNVTVYSCAAMYCCLAGRRCFNFKLSHPSCVYINNMCGYQSITQQCLKKMFNTGWSKLYNLSDDGHIRPKHVVYFILY